MQVVCSASCYQLASESLVKIIASEPCSESPESEHKNLYDFCEIVSMMCSTIRTKKEHSIALLTDREKIVYRSTKRYYKCFNIW